MKNVQIAIRNREYARALRHLLMVDGEHQVFIRHRPTSGIDGVILVDDEFVDDLETFEDSDFARCVVVISRGGSGVQKLFEAGIRHAIQADCPLHACRSAILNAESLLDVGELGEETIEKDAETPMPQDALWERMRDVRNAIATAVWNSLEVAKAMRELGREVQIEIDAVLINPDQPIVATPVVEGLGPVDISALDEADRRFLQALNISDR